MKKYIINGSLAAFMFLFGQSCTDLSETTYDVIPTDQFGNTPEQQAALIGPLYTSLGDYFGRYAELNTATDEQVIPTRGGDWGDGGAWRRLYLHTWEVVADNGRFNGMWTWCYNSITSINLQLAGVSDPAVQAELRALRAFYHYIAMDHFGNVIIADKIGGDTPVQKTRTEIFAWIESELLAVYDDLSDTAGGAYYGRFNKYVVDMFLAKLYLNAEVYTGTPQWAKVVDYTSRVIEDQKYSLVSDFFSNFSVTNHNSTEIILATPFDRSKRTGMNIQRRTLHYLNQLTYNLSLSTWNGYCTLESFYNSFEDQDLRKNMWLVGQQYNKDGTPLSDDGVPLAYNPVIPSLEMAGGPITRMAGARSQKYEIQRNNTVGDQDNDFVIFRLGDAYMMRGEANFRLGKSAEALEDINVIRRRALVAEFTSLDLDKILAERGREFAWEYQRRQDLIRFGKFTAPKTFKTNTSPEFRNLYPIPKDQLDLNPKLNQNPGY